MTDAKEIRLDVSTSPHTWEDLVGKVKFIDPVEYPKVEPPPQEDPDTFSERRRRARASMNEGVVDTNIFPGLGPEAAAMHEAIFGPGTAKKEDDAFNQLSQDMMRSFEKGFRIAKAARRMQMINRFKSRLLRTWGMIAAIPQTLSIIWTKPPCAVDEMLVNLTDGISSYLQAIEHVYSYSGVDWGVDKAPSRHCGPVVAFCTQSRNPMSGLAALVRNDCRED